MNSLTIFQRSNTEKIIKSKKFFEGVFISVIITSFIIWLIKIFHDGNSSDQFHLFFQSCTDFFADTLNVIGYSSQRDAYNNTMYKGLAEKAYPPLVYVFMYFFSRLVDMDKYYQLDCFLEMYQEPKFLIIFLILTVLLMIMIYELVRTCKTGSNTTKIFTSITILVSAPMLYSFERANTIILTMFCTLFFLFYYDSENRIMKELSLIAFAVAVALKITPAILGIVLLHKRQKKEIFCVIIYSVLLIMIPFAFCKGGFSNLPRMFENMQLNLSHYTNKQGCTLLASVLNFAIFPSETLSFVMKLVTYVVCAVFLISSFLLPTKWERMMAVCLTLVILPSHSGYYCILYLIPPILAFLNEAEHKYSDLLILMSILFIMQDIQGELSYCLCNYHTAILIMTAVLFIHSVTLIAKKLLCRFKPQSPASQQMP